MYACVCIHKLSMQSLLNFGSWPLPPPRSPLCLCLCLYIGLSLCRSLSSHLLMSLSVAKQGGNGVWLLQIMNRYRDHSVPELRNSEQKNTFEEELILIKFI